MTKQEAQDRLLDYLYGELTREESSAFEQVLHQHPELRDELEAHQQVQSAFSQMPSLGMPRSIRQSIFEAAEQAAAQRVQAPATTALGSAAASTATAEPDLPHTDPAMAARTLSSRSTKPAASVEDDSEPWWARLAALFMQPAFATAAVAVVVAGVGYFAINTSSMEADRAPADSANGPLIATATVERDEEEKREAAVVEEVELAAAPEVPADVADPRRRGAEPVEVAVAENTGDDLAERVQRGLKADESQLKVARNDSAKNEDKAKDVAVAGASSNRANDLLGGRTRTGSAAGLGSLGSLGLGNADAAATGAAAQGADGRDAAGGELAWNGVVDAPGGAPAKADTTAEQAEGIEVAQGSLGNMIDPNFGSGSGAGAGGGGAAVGGYAVGGLGGIDNKRIAKVETKPKPAAKARAKESSKKSAGAKSKVALDDLLADADTEPQADDAADEAGYVADAGGAYADGVETELPAPAKPQAAPADEPNTLAVLAGDVDLRQEGRRTGGGPGASAGVGKSLGKEAAKGGVASSSKTAPPSAATGTVAPAAGAPARIAELEQKRAERDDWNPGAPTEQQQVAAAEPKAEEAAPPASQYAEPPPAAAVVNHEAKGDDHYKSGNYPAAADSYGAALASSQGDPGLRIKLARTLKKAGRLSEAEAVLSGLSGTDKLRAEAKALELEIGKAKKLNKAKAAKAKAKSKKNAASKALAAPPAEADELNDAK